MKKKSAKNQRRYLLLIVGSIIMSCSGKTPVSMAEFKMHLTDTTQIFDSKDIPFGKTSVVIWFDPACRDCQIEAEFILANMNKFNNTNFYFVTKHSYEEMMVFHDHLNLQNYPNIKIGIDRSRSIPLHFNVRSTPLTIVLSGDKLVKAVFSGKPDFEKFTKIVTAKT